MGEKALVESQIADAISLIKGLDADGLSPNFAVWYYYDDADEWRLLIASPAFDALLPKQESLAYRKVAEAMTALSLSSLAISQVKVVASSSSLPQALKRLIGTDPSGLIRAHFSDTTLNGIFIKEMIVLRSAVGHAHA
jgi:hypothetical protein